MRGGGSYFKMKERVYTPIQQTKSADVSTFEKPKMLYGYNFCASNNNSNVTLSYILPVDFILTGLFWSSLNYINSGSGSIFAEVKIELAGQIIFAHWTSNLNPAANMQGNFSGFIPFDNILIKKNTLMRVFKSGSTASVHKFESEYTLIGYYY